MAKKNLPKFKLGDKWERITLVFALIFGTALFINVQGQLQHGSFIQASLFAGIKFTAIDWFWLNVALFHIAVMFLVARSIVKRESFYVYDGIAGFFATLGIILIVMTTIAIFQQEVVIPWLFGVKTLLLFQFAWLIEAVSLGYFGLTE